MSILENVKKHWVSVTAYLVFSLFFLGACLVSMNTYGAVAQAQRDIMLQNPSYDAEIAQHGNLNLSFRIQLVNPSRFTLHVNMIQWYGLLANSSNDNERVITVADVYVGPTKFVEIPAKTTQDLSYWSVISDPVMLSKLFGFVNYSKGQGQDYTIDTLPYFHEFSITVFIGEFEHEYDREGYLNSLVTVRLDYSSLEAT
jgi:hypothetical protein